MLCSQAGKGGGRCLACQSKSILSISTVQVLPLPSGRHFAPVSLPQLIAACLAANAAEIEFGRGGNPFPASFERKTEFFCLAMIKRLQHCQ